MAERHKHHENAVVPVRVDYFRSFYRRQKRRVLMGMVHSERKKGTFNRAYKLFVSNAWAKFMSLS